MKIAVIGAGIVGITTAYELAADGHEVTVFERRLAAAEESSFATGAMVASSLSEDWAWQPWARFKTLQTRWPLTGRELAWLWRSRRTRALDAAQRLHQFARYSQARLHHLQTDLELDFERSPGSLMLLRTSGEHTRRQSQLQGLRDAGMAVTELSSEQARKIEPALNPDTPLHCAIHLPDDQVGNCRQFALLLKNIALSCGVQFSFGSTVHALTSNAGGMALQLAGEASPRQFNAAVLCAGVDSSALLRSLGVAVPLVAVHGYSVSASVREPLNAPRSAVLDARHRISISRLGNRVRVAGTAQVGGGSAKNDERAIQKLYQALHDWFPGAAKHSNGVQVWRGARPMLPDGAPMLGASGVPGLWLNLGHADKGWALSCGSARVLADLIAGRQAEVDLQGLGLRRC